MTINVQARPGLISGGGDPYSNLNESKVSDRIDVKFVQRIVENNKPPEKPLPVYHKVDHPMLLTFLHDLWRRAHETRSQITDDIIGDVDAREGRYTDSQLSHIRQRNAPEIYMKTTLEKCRALEAQLKDIYLSNVRKPWSITHSPEPEVPKSMRNQVMLTVKGILMQYMEAGILDQVSREAAQSFAGELMDSAQRTLIKEYRAAAKALEKLVDDHLLEGGWRDALARFIYYFVTSKAGFIKGPITRCMPKDVWKRGKRKAEERYVLTWEAPNPLDIYPAPDCRDPNQAYIFEKHRYSINDIYAMREIDGALTANIDELIVNRNVNGSFNATTRTTSDYQRKRQEMREISNDLVEDIYNVLEFSGWITGYMLKQYGLPIERDDFSRPFYCNIYLDDKRVYYISYSDKQPVTRYHMASLEKTPDSFWGQGVPEVLSHLQDAINSMIRAAIKNVSLASGPQVLINDVSRIVDPNKFNALEPWAMWVSSQPEGGEYTDKSPIEFFQPQLVVNNLLNFYTVLEQRADSLISIPSYPYDELKGAARETASGMSIALSQGRQGMKEHSRKIDINVIEPAIKSMCDALYDMYPEREDIKGDIFCKTIGSETDFNRDRNLARYNELLATISANPLFVEVMGISTIEKLLKEIVEIHGIDLGEDLEDQEKRIAGIMQRMAEEQQMQRQQGMSQGQSQQGQIGPGNNQARGQPQSRPASQSKPKNTNSDGSTYGGSDSSASKSDGGKAKK